MRPLALVALVTCLAGLITVDDLNPQWSWVEEPASHFVNGRGGWLTTVALLSLSLGSALVTWSAVDAARAEQGTWRGPRVQIGLWSLGVWSVGVLVAAVFPADPPGQWDRPLSTSATIHGLAGNAAFVAFVVAVATLTWSRRDGRLDRVLWIAGTAAVIAFALFAVTLVDVLDGPSMTFGPYEKIVGLTERLTLLANVVWLGIVAVRLRRVRVTA